MSEILKEGLKKNSIDLMIDVGSVPAIKLH